jgi:hypothetical protein
MVLQMAVRSGEEHVVGVIAIGIVVAGEERGQHEEGQEEGQEEDNQRVLVEEVDDPQTNPAIGQE